MAAVTITVLAEASQATSELKSVGTAADTMSTDLKNADRATGRLNDHLDGIGGGAAKAGGGLGDLGGALAAVGGEGSKLAGIGDNLAAAQPIIMGVAGAMDLMTLALNKNVIAWAKNAASSVASKVAQVAGTAATAAATAAQWLLNTALLANPIGLIIIAVIALVAAFVLLWKNSETFRNIVTAAWNAIKSATVTVFNFIKGFLTSLWNGIKSYFTTMFTVYKAIFTAAFNAIKTVISTVFNVIKTVISTALNAVKTAITNFIAGAKAVWNGISALATKASEIINKVVGFFKGLWGKISGTISAIPGKLVQFGKDIMSGLVRGLDAGIQWVKSKIASIANMIPDTVKSILRIGSPSKVLADLGKDTMLGYNKGIESQVPKTEQAISGITDAVMALDASPSLKIGADVTGAAGTAGGGAGGAVPVTINIYAQPGTNTTELARAVKESFKELTRQTGKQYLVTTS